MYEKMNFERTRHYEDLQNIKYIFCILIEKNQMSCLKTMK